MQTPLVPANETDRVVFLKNLHLLDTPPDERFDRITRLAIFIFSVPIATITFVDENREWHKSCEGLKSREGLRSVSFCGHVIQSGEPLEIPDTKKDSRFIDNPMVTGYPNIRYYLGLPIKFNHMTIGTFCLKDTKPRPKLKEFEFTAALALAAWSKSEITLAHLITILSPDQQQLFL